MRCRVRAAGIVVELDPDSLAALDSVRLPATAALAVAEREAAARRDTQRLVEMLRQAPVTLPDPAWVRYTPRR